MRFVARSDVRAPREALYAWHARPHAFVRLNPPTAAVPVVEDSGGIGDGARKVIALGPFRLVRWVAVHEAHVAGRQFADVQVRGPFRAWRHVHSFLDAPGGGSTLVDEIEYEMPLGRVGEAVLGRVVDARLRRLFVYRHRVTVHDVELAALEPAGSMPVRLDRQGCSPGRVAFVEAFLAAIGWNASWVTGHSTRRPGDALVLVDKTSAVVERGERRETVALRDLEDASLAVLHRTLRRFETAGR